MPVVSEQVVLLDGLVREQVALVIYSDGNNMLSPDDALMLPGNETLV